MNMTAPSVAMMMGAEISASHVAAEGKPTETGKSFAASLDERIAADAEVAVKSGAEMNAQQTAPGIVTVISGDGQDAGHEPVATAVAKSLVVLRTSAVKDAGMISSARTPAAGASTNVVMQETPIETATDGQTPGVSGGNSGDADVKLLDDAASGTLQTKCASSVQAQDVKAQALVEISHGEQTGAVSSATGVETNAQLTRPSQESVPASSQNNASAGSESASSTKETAKKHNAAKPEGSTKTVGSRTATGIAIGATPVVVPAAVVSQPAAPRRAIDAISQTSAASALKQGTAPVVAAGAQAAALSTGNHQDNAQHVTLKKATGDSIGVANQAASDLHVVQMNTQTPAKPVDSTTAALSQATAQATKSPAKLQPADASLPVSHSAGTAGATVNAPGVATALQVPIAIAQKSVLVDAPAALPTHIGSGDLPGAGGTQATTLNDSHKTLVATPTVLEVGIPNGTQGWLKVRAELTSGGVNASLSAASSAGQEMLHRELPALTTYLQQEKVAVNSLVVQTSIAGGFRGLPGGAGGYPGGQPQQQSQSGRDSFVPPGGTAHADAIPQTMDELPAAMQYPGGGGWLSVRA